MPEVQHPTDFRRVPTAVTVGTEAVPDSPFPARMMLVEAIDGAYIPLSLRVPKGEGPFPLVLFGSGNGGLGFELLRFFNNNRSWTQERFLEAGYAVAWTRYRAEVDYAYDKIGKLVIDGRQFRQLLNRGPLEYEDAIAIAEYVKTLPEIDGGRLGWMGSSHAGEMVFKISSEYKGFRAMIASEPATHEFLRLRPDETAQINPETGLLNVEKMLMREPEKVRARITEDVARARIAPIETPILVQGRDTDELQGIFRVSYDLLHEMGKDAEWATYDHHLHGFVFPARDESGTYIPNELAQQSVRDSLGFFAKHFGC